MQISYDEKLKNCPFKSDGTKAGPAQLLMNKYFMQPKPGTRIV
jgi:hypothetical protein